MNQLAKIYFFTQGNQIGDEGAKKIGEALATNNTLTELDLQVRFQLLENKV